jgi:hypothetical protein
MRKNAGMAFALLLASLLLVFLFSLSRTSAQAPAATPAKNPAYFTIESYYVEKAFDEDLVVPYKKQLFPDLDALGKSEQHRFELLLAHWDTETAEQAL